MRRREPHPADAVDFPHRPQQVGEQRPALGQVATVGVHVLAEQGDLDDALLDQGTDLVDDLVERAADLATPHRRHDAEGARVVAADLDRHPGGVTEIPAHRKGGRELLGLLDDLELRDPRRGSGGQQ
jgi:hypothetical protein